MKRRTDKSFYQWIAIGLPLALLLALLVVWSAVASAPPAGTDGHPVLYEIILADAGEGRLEVVVPPDFAYVGLAASSQFGQEPTLVEDGRRLIWDGPFSGAETLRFWLFPLGSVAAPDTLEFVGTTIQAVRVEPVVASPAEDGAETPAGPLDGVITITKSVEPEVINPGDNRFVVYEVLFESDTPGSVTLDRITDTLPTGFMWGGMAFGSDVVTEPLEAGDYQFVWESISFEDTLTMRYHVKAVELSGEYQNAVVALAGGELFGPASATLLVNQPGVAVTKEVSEDNALPGDAVDYMVNIHNTGDVTDTIELVTDTLPAGFSFVEMLPGDITGDPSVDGNVLTWALALDLGPDEAATLAYRVQVSGSGEQINTVVAKLALAGQSDPATSSVLVGEIHVFLPAVFHNLQPPEPPEYPLPWTDDFKNGVSDDWQPFLNYPGLSEGRWYWAGDLGVYGLYNYDAFRVEPENTVYDLSIFNASGTELWTDYRIEARFKDIKDEGALRSGLVGIWFRGTYEDSGAMDGKTVGGYYVYMKQPSDALFLMRTPPDNPSFAAAQVVASYSTGSLGRFHWYKFIVEVQGNNIKAWFEDDEDGVDNPVLVFNWTDPLNAWPSGTVGFAIYYSSARFDYITVSKLE
jgi:uncharacterized repeat protein (TIGR01451 family)